MKTRRVFQSLAALLLMMSAGWEGQVAHSAADSPRVSVATTNSQGPTARLPATYAQLPLYFEANQGQADANVKFLARGSGYSLALTANEAILALASSGGNGETAKRGKGQEPQPLDPNPQPSMVRMQLVGANTTPAITGLAELPGKTNYFVGKEAAQWRTNIPTYAKVKYEQVYPGIDLVYYGNQQQLEYDFLIQPGADPKAIRLAFAGMSDQSSLRIDDKGDIVVATAAGDVRFHRPHIYQESGGIKKVIAGRYVIVDSGEAGTSLQSPSSSPQVGFEVAAYDTTKPLIIDPVLSYATYLSGLARAITVDTDGNIYVTGETSVTVFPGAKTVIGSGGEFDMYVVKLNASGSTLIYATIIGGSDSDASVGIAVDAQGSAYVAGNTSSSDFPLSVGAFKQTCLKSGGLQKCREGFVLKLNPAGTGLRYSTYLGLLGFTGEIGGLALDSAGHAYVTGSVNTETSTDLSTTAGAFQDTCRANLPLYSCDDVFVTKLDPTGSALVYSTFLGSSLGERSSAIAVDSEGNAYIAGDTVGADFPATAGVVQPTCRISEVDSSCRDAFVAKLNPTGSALVYSTFLGGKYFDGIYDIAVDSVGSAYVVGGTSSSDFPTTSGVFREAASGGGFLSKLNPFGSALVYSTYLDFVSVSVTLDAVNNAYVAGSRPTPVVCARGGFGQFPIHCQSAFVAKLNTIGTELTYSAYFGGDRDTFGLDVAVDAAGNAYLVGYAGSSNFPVVNPLQSSGGGFIVKLAERSSEIVSYLDSPEEGPVSGITTIHGWAFATEAEVRISRVELFVDGQRVSDIPGIALGDIPCCSERQDVRDTFPQFPAENTLNSGWGITFNWSLLSAGSHTIQIWITSTRGEVFLTDARIVNVVKPGDFEFLDQFTLSQATVSIQNPDLVVNGVVVRDKATQQQKTVNTRFRWFTSTQSLGLVQAEMVGTSSAQWVAPPFSAWFASLASRVPGWPMLASAQAASVIVPYFEAPASEQIVSGIGLIRGWAFSEEATARISAIRLTTDSEPQGTIPCCSGRGDVATAFPGQPNALNSGWGATFNYGNLTSGTHTVGVQIEDSTGTAILLAHNVTVVRLGGYAFVDQFDLSSATARLEGEEITLSGVVVRDKASQQIKTIDVRLRWSQSSQGLEVVAATE
jgi:hypothetical protein